MVCDMKYTIKNIKRIDDKLNTAIIRQPHFLQSDFYQRIIDTTKFLQPNVRPSERIYCWENNLTERSCCDKCGKPKRFITYQHGYNDCSLCYNTNPHRTQKIKQTKLERHGSSGFNNRKKAKQTEYLLHGKLHTQNHIQNTSLEKLNNAIWLTEQHHTQRKPIQQIANELIVSISTVLRALHKKNIEIKEYRFNKRAQKFLQNKEWLQKIYQTHNIKEIADLLSKLDRFAPRVAYHTIFVYLKKHKILTNRHCNRSKGEKKVVDYIKKILPDGMAIKLNDKTIIPPNEIDIYIPEKKVAIEYNGIFWHSFNRMETPEEKKKHINKTNACEKQNIQLLQIFENEWLYKKDIVKSIINSKLGINQTRIFARKCYIKEIDSEISSKFQEQNHIQGSCVASIHIGLFYKDELVSLMTFGKPRFNKKYEYELVRFCNKLYTQIVGGASKLLKHFIKTYYPKSIISYADRRYSTGKLYKAIGFKCLYSTVPNYFYYKKEIRLFSRNKFQKHKLAKILPNFDPNKTESENMFLNGYRRVWDSGNLVFIWLLANS